MITKVKGLMLKCVNYKENDKILTLFTEELGKITASLRGVRKADAKLKFAGQPFSFAEFILAEKSGRYTVTSCTLIESFYSLREDFSRLCAGYSILEICDKLYLDGLNSPEMLYICIKALKDICLGDDEVVVLNQFILRAIQFCGYAFSCSECAKCGKILKGSVHFSFKTNNFYCADCHSGRTMVSATFNNLKKLMNLPYKAELIECDSNIRVLKFLAYFLGNTVGEKIKSLDEFILL